MKRSEALEIIDTILHEHDLPLLQGIDKEILGALEKAGMLPPARYREHNWHELGITYSDWLQLPSKVNEWEKEDNEQERS